MNWGSIEGKREVRGFPAEIREHRYSGFDLKICGLWSEEVLDLLRIIPVKRAYVLTRARANQDSLWRVRTGRDIGRTARVRNPPQAPAAALPSSAASYRACRASRYT